MKYKIDKKRYLLYYVVMEIFKKYHITTYGCQMNIHESEKLAGILCKMGYVSTDKTSDADVIVFNTCCIRENAEDKAEGNIGALKGLKKLNKNVIIAVGGCMTQQRDYAEYLRSKFPFIDIIFGTHNLEDFGKLLQEKLSSRKKIIEVLEKEGCVKEGTPKMRTSFPNAWVNIMYGCNNFCTYCIVPYVRGRERSRKIEDIVLECKELVEQGYKEITLLGQNVNSYGKDLENADFSKLIDEISKIDGKFRLSFMTNHPKDLTEDLVKSIAKSDKTCKNIHLPIQSGSNKILKLMNRKYTREDYLSKIAMLKKHIPDVEITTDIMVGFPKEDEQDFIDTLDIVKNVRYSGAFTFIYSKRDGTPAQVMEGQVSEDVAKRRIMQLIELQNEISKKDTQKYVGKTIEVLCEDYDTKKDRYMGRDVYGKMAYFNSNKSLIGQFINVKIVETNGISLIGEII